MFNQWREWWNNQVRRYGLEDEDVPQRASITQDDPEFLLSEAQRQMREVHARNRERAVQAITQKNNLQFMLDDARAKMEAMRAHLIAAEVQGDATSASLYRAEVQQWEQCVRDLEENYAKAVSATEAVKEAIRTEEETIRRKTSEAMSLQAQWRLVQVESKISRWQAEFRAHQEGASLLDIEQQRIQVVEAMQARDDLRRMVEESTRQIATLRIKAGIARQRGDEHHERQFLREMEQSEAALDRTQEALNRADAIVERLGALMRGETNEWIYQDVEPVGWEETPTPADRDPDRMVGWLLLAAVAILGLLLLFFFLIR
jgi:phage shock protein A